MSEIEPKREFELYLGFLAFTIALAIFSLTMIFETLFSYASYSYTTHTQLPPLISQFPISAILGITNLTLLVILFLMSLKDGGIKGKGDYKVTFGVVSIFMSVAIIILLFSLLFIALFNPINLAILILPSLILTLIGLQIYKRTYDYRLILVITICVILFLVLLFYGLSLNILAILPLPMSFLLFAVAKQYSKNGEPVI
jgi:hypothetical protein